MMVLYLDNLWQRLGLVDLLGRWDCLGLVDRSGSLHHADAAFPAWDGGRWSDGKRRSARKNLSKHATHSKKKILKKNDADLKFSIFQTGDFYISNSQNEKKWCNRACVRVRGSNFYIFESMIIPNIIESVYIYFRIGF